MPAIGYKFPIYNSDGNVSTTSVDMGDMFVFKDQFLNAGLYGWGDDTYGQIGANVANDRRSSPVQIGSLTNWKRVFGACGKAIKTDGTLWGWGRNSEGNVGVGTATDRSSPIQIGTETTWKSCNYDGYNTTRMTTFAIKDGYF